MERKPYSGTGPRRSVASSNSRSGSAARTPASSARNASARAQQNRAGSASNRNYSGAYQRPSNPNYKSATPSRTTNVHRHPAHRPQKRRKPQFGFVHFVVLALILFLAIYFGSAWFTVSSERNTYCANIFVNGIDLDDYTREGGLQLVRESADARLNISHTLTYNGRTWSFSAADFGGVIDIESVMDRAWNLGHVGSFQDRKNAINSLKDAPYELTAELVYDIEKLDQFVDEIYNAIYVAPVDAEVTITTERPILTTESSTGLELDREYTREQIISLIETGSGETVLKVDVVDPAISSNAAGTLEVIVEYSTDTSFRGYNSRENVKKALSVFNYLCVYPGDTISFNDMVGPRTESRGWLEAPEYAGNTVSNGFGGGTCQASTTLYGAVMLAGMDILERHPHGMTVQYVDPSLDAAVTDTGKNLIFQNNTDYAIYIYTEVTKEKATVTIYGNKPDYEYKLVSKTLTQENYCTNNSYKDDTEGKYVYYTNETKLESSGRPACTSEGWLIAYNWETGEEVSRKQLSYDIYASGTNVYWRGIHDPVTGLVVTATETPT